MGNLLNTFDDDCSYMPQIWGIVFEDLDPRVSFFFPCWRGVPGVILRQGT